MKILLENNKFENITSKIDSKINFKKVFVEEIVYSPNSKKMNLKLSQSIKKSLIDLVSGRVGSFYGLFKRQLMNE